MKKLLPWVQKAVQFLTVQFLNKKYPGYANLFNRIDDVLEFAIDVVTAAEASGADGATKKAMAVANLKKNLAEAKFDLPGDFDDEVLALFVEAVLLAVKSFFYRT